MEQMKTVMHFSSTSTQSHSKSVTKIKIFSISKGRTGILALLSLPSFFCVRFYSDFWRWRRSQPRWFDGWRMADRSGELEAKGKKGDLQTLAILFSPFHSFFPLSRSQIRLRVYVFQRELMTQQWSTFIFCALIFEGSCRTVELRFIFGPCRLH